MSEAVTTNEDGALVIDMAKADALWRSLDPLKQAELTNMMFEPVLTKAKEQADHIEELEAKLAKEEALMFAGFAEYERRLAKAIEAVDNAATLVEKRHFIYMTLSGRDHKNYNSDLSLIAEELRLASANLKGEQP